MLLVISGGGGEAWREDERLMDGMMWRIDEILTGTTDSLLAVVRCSKIIERSQFYISQESCLSLN